MRPAHARLQRGFTLLELAVVLAVVALLLGGLVVPLTAQVEMRQAAEAREILHNAREALLGFAIANGRLPCPATAASKGIEDPPAGGNCKLPHDGFLPAATLGILPVDAEGFAVDPWGNRIRYAVTTANGAAFTTANGIGNQFVVSAPTPDLQVCATGVGISGGNCAAGSAVTKVAAAVLFSPGPNGMTGAGGPDEAHNQNGDRVFVSRVAGTSASSDFDDIVIWLSPHVLYGRLVAAGKLP